MAVITCLPRRITVRTNSVLFNNGVLYVYRTVADLIRNAGEKVAGKTTGSVAYMQTTKITYQRERSGRDIPVL